MGDNATMHKQAPKIDRDRPRKVLEEHFAKHLKNNHYKLTDSELARQMQAAGCGVNQSTISRIRSGKLVPDLETSLKFSTFLEMDVLTFMGVGFWTKPPPDSFTTQARNVARRFQDLNASDKNTIERMLEALSKTTVTVKEKT